MQGPRACDHGLHGAEALEAVELVQDHVRPEVLGGAPVVLGRERAAPFRLDHPEASGAHCTLRFDVAAGVLTREECAKLKIIICQGVPRSAQNEFIYFSYSYK